MDTSGFYKLANGGLLFAPAFVAGPSFEMHRENPEDKTDAAGNPVVIDGWRWFDTDADAYAFHNITTTTPPSTSITRLQAKLELLAAGKLSAVEAIVASADQATKLAWQDALSFERASPLLNAMASMVGISQAELDAMFERASLIKV